MKRLARLLYAFRVFTVPSDVFRYYRLRRATGAGTAEPVSFRIRSLGGRRVWCRPGASDADVLRETFQYGFHLPPVRLRQDCTILDLGCNVGYTMAHFAALSPGGRVIGYELDRSNVEMAVRNTTVFADRCSVVHAGVWTQDGVFGYAGRNHAAFRVIVGSAAEPATTPASTKTMRRIIAEQDLAYVDYVKMDVEGAEAGLIAEEDGWLDHVGALKIEVHEPDAFAGIQKRLETRGFGCWRDTAHWACCVAVRTRTNGANR